MPEMPEYPNPCCRCGYCCIVQLCPVVIEMIGLRDMPLYGKTVRDKTQFPPCPYLEFKDDEFACGVARELYKTYPKEKVDKLMGICKGCCIKARAYKDGVEYDFASLPPEMKKAVAKSLWEHWGKEKERQHADSIS